MSETFLVTGSTGFIGARLLERLVQQGEKIRVFLRLESDASALPDVVEVVRGSFSDPEVLADAVRGVDRILHLAGVTKALDEAGYNAGNVMPVEHLLAAVEKHNPALKRFLYVSSLTAGGPASEGIRGIAESDQPHPVSAYGRSKLRAEALCLEHAAQLPVTIVRPPAVYGPGDKDVLQVFQMLSRGLLVTPGSEATQRFSMIYVDDLVEGIMMAARSERSVGRLYFITSPAACSWEEVVAAAKPLLGFTKLYTISLPKPLIFFVGGIVGAVASFWGKVPLLNRDKANELVQDFWVCSPERANHELGFTARTTLADGVSKTITWYRQKGWM